MAQAGRTFSAESLQSVLFDQIELGRGCHVQVAFSGGLDSHVLLHALVSLRERGLVSVSALHANHMLVAESLDWEEHCRRICEGYKVPCQVERLNVSLAPGQSAEQQARRARYAWFSSQVTAACPLATAHHRDDQAETLLLQLLRGSGINGLVGMPVTRPLGTGLLMRPLLGFDRGALHHYAETVGLRWIEDPTNEDIGLDRNYLRHQVIPKLRMRWPQLPTVLQRVTQHMGDAKQILDGVAEADMKRCLRFGCPHLFGNDAVLSVSGINALSPARTRNMLRFWLRSQGFPVPSRSRLDQLIARCRCSQGQGDALIAWNGTEVRRYRDGLYTMAKLAAGEPQGEVAWHWTQPLELVGAGLRLVATEVGGSDIAKRHITDGILTLRWRRGGERAQLPLRCHRHSLKKLYQTAGIPPWERRLVPLVYIGERLAAVPRVAVFAPFQANPTEAGVSIRVEPLGHLSA
ncbi:MAG: tRNA lysidine(34) synthetase TilS [Gammaproteobacteria bacterium]|nr:tRNA lysidine(34) synthetase TilS [Gammaproteobacteria bacterium]